MNFPVTQLTVPVNQKYGYIRVSSKSQESNYSLESQKQELLRHQIPLDNIGIEQVKLQHEIKREFRSWN